MLYFIVTYFLYLYLKVQQGVKIYNKKKLPKNTFILISNHLNNSDPFLLSGICLPKQLHFLAKDSLFSKPIRKWFFQKLHATKLDRAGDPREPINISVAHLEQKRNIALFPEGTRNKINNELQPFKKGAALIAKKSDALIVPVAIINTNTKDKKILIKFGDPFKSIKNEQGKIDVNLTNEKMFSEVNTLLTELIALDKEQEMLKELKKQKKINKNKNRFQK